eukprot:scpid90725/ scgid22181/ Guanylate kinase; GMP kinase
MLRALRRHQLPAGRANNSISLIFNRRWDVPPERYRKLPYSMPSYVTPEMQRTKELRESCWKQRDAYIEEQQKLAENFVENSKVRQAIVRAKKVSKFYYFMGAVTVGGLVYIWFTWRKDRKQVKGMREAALNTQLSDEVPEEIVIDKSDLPRPLILVGPSGEQMTTLMKSLVQGRENLFGLPVLHTTRDARDSEVEGEEFWFAPRAALEQGVYSGAFVSHGNVRVGDKRFGYGLSKGSIADVRLSGRVCLLNLDVEHADVVSKTDLRPIVVLVSPASPAAALPEDVAAAKKAGKLFQLEITLGDGQSSLDAARDNVLALLAEQFTLATRTQRIISGEH